MLLLAFLVARVSTLPGVLKLLVSLLMLETCAVAWIAVVAGIHDFAGVPQLQGWPPLQGLLLLLASLCWRPCC